MTENKEEELIFKIEYHENGKPKNIMINKDMVTGPVLDIGGKYLLIFCTDDD